MRSAGSGVCGTLWRNLAAGVQCCCSLWEAPPEESTGGVNVRTGERHPLPSFRSPALGPAVLTAELKANLRGPHSARGPGDLALQGGLLGREEGGLALGFFFFF